jgi:hypothetical protein
MSRYFFYTELFFYTATVTGVFPIRGNVDMGADWEGHAVGQGIRIRLLESRIGAEECFSLLEYFLDRHCIVVLAKCEDQLFTFCVG